MPEKLKPWEFMLGLTSVVGLAALVSGCGGSGDLEGDINEIRGEVSAMELVLRDGSRRDKTEICVSYAVVCERAAGVCLSAQHASTHSRCRGIADRCERNLSQYCRHVSPRMDAGCPADALADAAGSWWLDASLDDAGYRRLDASRDDAGYWRLDASQGDAGYWRLDASRDDAGYWRLDASRDDAGYWRLDASQGDAGYWRLDASRDDAGSR